MRRRALLWVAWVTVAVISGGCRGGTSVKTVKPNVTAPPVVLDANKEQLIDKYNRIATGVQTLNATVVLKPTTGSRYSGVIEEYHEVKAFLLAARPEDIRVIGQAPVIGTTIFDMVSDGQTFKVLIPSQDKFLVGPVALERTSEKPIENLRPQHLLDALLWPEIQKEEAVLFEEADSDLARYYVLTVLRGGYQMEILRKIWFDRADLQISRLEGYGPRGSLLSDVHVSDWEPVGPDTGQAASSAAATTNASVAGTAPVGVLAFPRAIRIERPHDDYRLDLQITKLVLNEPIPADRFKLDQPAGTELVRVGSATQEKKP